MTKNISLIDVKITSIFFKIQQKKLEDYYTASYSPTINFLLLLSKLKSLCHLHVPRPHPLAVNIIARNLSLGSKHETSSLIFYVVAIDEDLPPPKYVQVALGI